MSFVTPFVVEFCLSLVLCISLHVLTSLTIILCVCGGGVIPLGVIGWSVIVEVPGLRTCFLYRSYLCKLKYLYIKDIETCLT